MDLFKLLTRSSKLTGKRQASVPQSVPSAGQNASPQLFGETESPFQTTSGKRKRIDDIDDSDFFASGTISTSEHKPMKQQRIQEGQEFVENDGSADNLAEWKRILRTHKVKITSLSRGSQECKNKSEKQERKKAPQAFTRPLSSFSQLGSRYNLRRTILQNIDEQGYQVPTEIQLSALPLLLGEQLVSSDEDFKRSEPGSGCFNLLAVAPTGSGKTLAFLVPVVRNLLLARSQRKEKHGPYALVLVPTRELASQIVNEARKLVLNTGIRVSLVKKGMKIGTEDGIATEQTVDNNSDSSTDDEQQISADQPNANRTIVKSDIVVATPLALVHALERGDATQAQLPSINYLVLDEADVLLDPLFQSQTLSIWNACISEDLRVNFWSATMASNVEELVMATIQARQGLNTAETIRLVVGLKDSTLPTITHKLMYAATETGKLVALRQLLHPTAVEANNSNDKSNCAHRAMELRPPFLVFTQTISRAIALHAELRYDIPPEAGGSARLAVLHAGLPETARSQVMAQFRKGEIWVIITTDLLARGVDFRGLNGVINYDIPTSAAAYVHRAGRTGRAGRLGGTVITLYTKEDILYIKPIANVIAASDKLKDGASGGAVQQWLLDALPNTSKRDKKQIKERGVECRRPGSEHATISTKPPRKHSRKSHAQSSKPLRISKPAQSTHSSDFEGFED